MGLGYIIFMMNDMMPTIEETITPDIAAEIEFREWERDNEERERWGAVEAIHGPLLTKLDLENYHRDMAEIARDEDIRDEEWRESYQYYMDEWNAGLESL